MRGRLKQSEGSVQGIEELPETLRAVYRTAWELPMGSLIDMAADRGAFIDQSQSLNLFIESPNIGQLSSMYFYAWKKGLKTTYYLRSRPATRITQTTVAVAEPKEEQGTGNKEPGRDDAQDSYPSIRGEPVEPQPHSEGTVATGAPSGARIPREPQDERAGRGLRSRVGARAHGSTGTRADRLRRVGAPN